MNKRINKIKIIGIKILLIISIFVSQIPIIQAQNNIKMYTFYSPSHVEFKNIWLNSFNALNDKNIEPIIKEFPQECKTGKVWDAGWQKAMLRKVDMILEAIDAHWNEIIIYSDIDIEFFKPIGKKVIELLGDKDLVIQRDNPSGTVCAGFFVFRANEKTKALWTGIKNYMITYKECSDQKTLNRLLRKNNGNKLNPYKIIWDYLPANFLGGGTLTGTGWKIGTKLFIPSDIIMLHANFTRGVKNKLALLDYVRGIVKKRQAKIS